MSSDKIKPKLTEKSADFIRSIIEEDLRNNKHGGKIVTRFPPEPNGYLHIGHAKSICLNFGLAKEYKGVCHLRFDDTDPVKEEALFEESIKDAVRWLGFDWGERLFHASDYFDELYDLALQLIEKKKAYVCSLDIEEIRKYRGSVTEAGKNSPYRNRSIEENLELFSKMKAGQFKDGEHVLRAKIDMASPNMKMRDPLLYRIRHVPHHMTGNKWCIYPLYDFTHCLSDSIEGITHSICTLEFENNRELYDWIIEELDMPNKPKQYEFARLNINYAVMSKRKILTLVEGKHVEGWDDPRLLTIAGLRRRGYTPESIRNFCARVGIAKANSTVDTAQLEFEIRDDLNGKAPRALAVLNPLKAIITNYPEEKTEQITAPYFPEDIPKDEFRQVPFAREIYIERDDFMENPSKGFFRLSPNGEVRLRYAYIIRCNEVVKNEKGEIVLLKCTYDEKTKMGENPYDSRKIKGVIHWVSAKHALAIETRLYDRLFTVEDPGEGGHEDYLSHINQNSLVIYRNSFIEPSIKGSPPETHFQFERLGYFVTDMKDSSFEKMVFNRTAPLKDSWNKKKLFRKSESSSLKENAARQKEKRISPKETKISLNQAQNEIFLRYKNETLLPEDYAVLLAQNKKLSSYFDRAVQSYGNPSAIANWMINELLGKWNQPLPPIEAERLAMLIKFIDEEKISSKIAKNIFEEMLSSNKSPKEIIEEKGWQEIRDENLLSSIIDTLIDNHPDIVKQIKAGRDKRISFFIGQIMKITHGKACPKLVNRLLAEKLKM